MTEKLNSDLKSAGLEIKHNLICPLNVFFGGI